MISVQEALNFVDRSIVPLEQTYLPVAEAGGLVLAHPLFAPTNMPWFRQSSMDGYAICSHGKNRFTVEQEVQAGPSINIPLSPGQAVRIFTGAMVPDDADTVVIQEHVEVSEDSIEVLKMPGPGSNIRNIGEQVKIGEPVLQAGTILNPAAIGFLMGMGFTSVPVFPRPRVRLLITGNELRSAGQTLQPGEIYESNSLMLTEALSEIGIRNVRSSRVADTLDATTEAIREALADADVLLISGGISVGEYDFVEEALHANSTNNIFYRVRQKPGKPLWFGQKEGKYVFALPGNPASGLTCFYTYVRPLLLGMMGRSDPHLPRKTAKLSQAVTNKSGRTLMLKSVIEDGNATPLSGQASSMLNTYAISNGLIIIPHDVTYVAAGELVDYMELPTS